MPPTLPALPPATPPEARAAAVTTILGQLDRIIAGDIAGAAEPAKRLTTFLECPHAQRAARLLYLALGASANGVPRGTRSLESNALAAPPGWLQPIP